MLYRLDIKFQFLLVRLKASPSIFNSLSTFSFQFLLVRLKVYNRQQVEQIKRTFQFLLVRLKGSSVRYKSYNNKISIPFGAIKRSISSE